MSETRSSHDITAAEYVIGLLSYEEANDFEDRAAVDPTLLESVRAWERRLEPLTEGLPSQAPPPELWKRIEASITPKQERRIADDRWREWHRNLTWKIARSRAGWMFAGGMIGAAAMALIITPKILMGQPAVAALTSIGAPMPAYLIMVTKDGYATIISDPSQIKSGNTLELWGIPKGATVPISLGVLPKTGRLKMPAIVGAGTHLLITEEPEGGAPAGIPTGPVQYQGKMVKG